MHLQVTIWQSGGAGCMDRFEWQWCDGSTDLYGSGSGDGGEIAMAFCVVVVIGGLFAYLSEEVAAIAKGSTIFSYL